MSAKVAIDVPVILPEVVDRGDRCAVLVARGLRSLPGVLRVHLPGHLDPSRFCIHHDPALIDAAEIEGLAREKGARVSAEVGHLLWEAGWIGDERAAHETREALGGLVGVLGAEVSARGVVRVEYDRRRIDAGAIERSLHALGLSREESGAGRRATRRILGPAAGLGLAAGGGADYVGNLLSAAPA